MTSTELLAAHREMEAEGQILRMTDTCAEEIVPGTAVASFSTPLEAREYALNLGRGYCVTTDTHLGWAVRKLMPMPSIAALKRVGP
jgi:hypothetical protein